MNRGDVVVVPFPYQDRLGFKIRPAVVIQSNSENRRLINTILAMVTGNLKDQGPTALVIDPAVEPGSGLHGPSLLKCSNLTTIRHDRVLRILGSLSAQTMQKVDQCIKAVLELP